MALPVTLWTLVLLGLALAAVRASHQSLSASPAADRAAGAVVLRVVLAGMAGVSLCGLAVRIVDRSPIGLVCALIIGAGVTALLLHAAQVAGMLPRRSGPLARHISGGLRAGTSAFARHVLTLPKAQDSATQARIALALSGLIGAALVLFLSVPSVDIHTSALFWTPEQGFYLARNETLAVIRQIYLWAMYLTVLGALTMLLFHWRLGAALHIPRAIWSFALAGMVIGPGLIANVLFKEHWGRARPATIIEFGGTAQFTLPFELSDQCATNCSFVSGEGSGITMLAIIIAVLGWSWFGAAPKLRLGGLGALATFGISLRIVLGRHFLSDTIFAALLMGLIAVALYRLLDIGRQRKSLNRAALGHDIAMIWRYVWGASTPCLCRDLVHVLRVLGHILRNICALLAALPRLTQRTR